MIIQGYASIFNVKDLQNDIILPQSFTNIHQCINSVPLLWQHSVNKVIGSIISINQNSIGLFIKANIYSSTKFSSTACNGIKNGITSMSIGYKPITIYTDQKTKIRHILKLQLLEVSIVTFAANPVSKIDYYY